MFKLCYLNAETVGEEPPAKVWRGCLTQYIIDPVLFLFHVKHCGFIMYGLKRRLKLWFKKGKHCKHCCLICPFYKNCIDELLERVEKEWGRKNGMV